MCRSKLVSPTRDPDGEEELYCPECDEFYGYRFDFKGVPIEDIGYDTFGSFHVRSKRGTLFIEQPRASHYEPILEALKKASEYTFLRYPSHIWRHPLGVCNLPPFNRGDLGTLYLVSLIDDLIVGFSHHNYFLLDEESKEADDLPVPAGTRMCNAWFCILDPYQNQGIGSLYARGSEYIAKHNGAEFMIGETFKEKGVLNIRVRMGWSVFGERVAEDGSTRVLIGRCLR